MAEAAELTKLHRAVDQLRASVADLRSRYGDVPSVRRLLLDVERLDIDAAELATAPPPPPTADAAVLFIDDSPLDPALWADADDEGVGGYHGGSSR
jgi:hypothetical protein